MVRKVLATKVNKRIMLNATYEGMHLPKGGSFIGRTLLFTDVTTIPKGENVSNHLWVQTNDYLQYEQFKNTKKTFSNN